MNISITSGHQPWNKGKLVGQKSPLRLRDIWGIRIKLELAYKVRDLALFDLAIDSKLRACDLTKLRVSVRIPRSFGHPFHGHPDTFRQEATQDFSLPSTSFFEVKMRQEHRRRGAAGASNV